jgi:ATP synthase protein I
MDHLDQDGQSELSREIAAKAARKLRNQRRKKPHFWTGVGMFGLVGWSVAVPALLGVALGIWLDNHYPSPHSWTLAGLLAGIVLGCFNAWYWVDKENKAIHKDLEDDE